MAKKKHKKTSRFEDVYEEMKWCLDRHIRVYADRYAVENNGVWEEQDLYRITVEQGERIESSGYIYTEKNIAVPYGSRRDTKVKCIGLRRCANLGIARNWRRRS